MTKVIKRNTSILINGTFISSKFNKKKDIIAYETPKSTYALEMQKLGKNQCLGKKPWKEIDKVNSWMLTAETETFMKAGGLGMIATALPYAFNCKYRSNGEKITVVTPMYIGDTKKKKASFDGKFYTGSEHRTIQVKKVREIQVPFMNHDEQYVNYQVDVYSGVCEGNDYLFLANDLFFDIDPHEDNPSEQGGCYVLNKSNINEVERFAFFSKSIFVLLTTYVYEGIEPNVLIANDWHSGAVSGLLKYLPLALVRKNLMDAKIADKLRNISVVHVAHHLGYQGWDYPNTAHILNSLYGEQTSFVMKNAKAIKNSNPRTSNTLIVHDSYNQASCNFHLADRVITVSKNYHDEISRELGLGYDFRDLLKIRKDHRTFFGIVNGYDKELVVPNQLKIKEVNDYFGCTHFKIFDEHNLEDKIENKREFAALISKIATEKSYKDKVIPLIDTYKFEDITDIMDHIENIPVLCATSRLVEQKGYDIAAQAIWDYAKKALSEGREMPVCVLGGSGNIALYDMLKNLKDEISKLSPKLGKRIFVFRGYRDLFAYAVQLAADFYLMPSRFEPCGLTQMEAMGKAALPVAMSTGGLVDTIIDGYDGFRTEVFFSGGKHVRGNFSRARYLKNNENAYSATLFKALNLFQSNPEKIREMKIHAIRKDFGWEVADGPLKKYYSLFHTGQI